MQVITIKEKNAAICQQISELFGLLVSSWRNFERRHDIASVYLPFIWAMVKVGWVFPTLASNPEVTPMEGVMFNLIKLS